MSVVTWITALTGIILCGAALTPISKKIKVPRDGLLLMLGFLVSELVTSQGYDTGLRWYHFKDIVFFGVLPLLVFNTALSVDTEIARHEIPSVFFLALPIRLITVSLIGVVMFYGVAHPSGFPLAAALLLAVMLTAPDPDSLIEHANLSRTYPRVCHILRGESLLDDVLAIMLFSLFLSMVMMAAIPPTLGDLTFQFVRIFCGGVVLGFVIGTVLGWLLSFMPSYPTKVMLLISIVYLSFVMAEKLFAVSGVVTMLVLGLTLPNSCSEIFEGTINVFAEILAIGLFFIAGMTLTTAMFAERWIAILLAGLAVIVARGVGVYIFILASRYLVSAEYKLTREENCLMLMSGAPGAVALALALSLPLDVPGWYTIQAAVYGVVTVGLLIQTPVVIAAFNWLKAR